MVTTNNIQEDFALKNINEYPSKQWLKDTKFQLERRNTFKKDYNMITIVINKVLQFVNH